MQNFTFHSPTKILFGAEQLPAFVSSVKSISNNLLVLTGGGSIKRLGYYEPVITALKEQGVNISEFSGIEPNPLAITINACADEFRTANIGAVLAFGGGSTMDAAKAIAALLHQNERDIWEFVKGSPGFGKFTGALPIICIPTTAATASEVTPFSVISDDRTSGKSPLAYEFFKPTLSWLNPEFTTKLSPEVTQDGAADILSHVFENYLLGGSDAPLTDRYCESIISTVLETLPALLKDPENQKLRGVMLWCSTLALNGMHMAGRVPSGFVMHAIEHSLSAKVHKLAHGRGLATIYPAYFRWLWNENRGREKLNQLGVRIFGASATDSLAGLKFIEQFENWLRVNHLLQSVYDLGFDDALLEQVADYAVTVYGANSQLNALGVMSKAQVVEVLRATRNLSPT